MDGLLVPGLKHGNRVQATRLNNRTDRKEAWRQQPLKERSKDRLVELLRSQL